MILFCPNASLHANYQLTSQLTNAFLSTYHVKKWIGVENNKVLPAATPQRRATTTRTRMLSGSEWSTGTKVGSYIRNNRQLAYSRSEKKELIVKNKAADQGRIFAALQSMAIIIYQFATWVFKGACYTCRLSDILYKGDLSWHFLPKKGLL